MESSLRRGGAPDTAPVAHKIVRVYLPSILANCGLLLYVSWPDATLWRELLVGARLGRLARELLQGALLFAATLGVRIAFHLGDAAGTAAILPRDRAEKLCWVPFALAAGFCEEMIFRGYLQRQLEALTWSAPLAIVAQAVLFAGLHGYQGARSMLFIALFGAALGVVARISGNLRIGIFCHCITDLIVLLFIS